MFLNRHRLDLWVKTFVGGNSAAATNFLARTSGLDATHQAAYAALLNGLTTDGFFDAAGNSTLLDVLQIYATQDAATAVLNLVSSSFTATPTSSPAFSADHGYTSNGSSSYVDVGYNASTQAVNYSLNSCHFSVWDLTNRLVADVTAQLAVNDGSNLSDLNTFSSANGGASLLWRLNSLNIVEPTVATAQGFSLASRTSATACQSYRDGVSLGAVSAAVGAIPVGNFFALARNNSGTAGQFTTDQIGVVSIGAGLTPTQAAAFYARIHTYMQTIAGVA